MIRLAIGPEKDTPSWNWVGFDTQRELSNYYNVLTFTSYEKMSLVLSRLIGSPGYDLYYGTQDMCTKAWDKAQYLQGTYIPMYVQNSS
jgi:hypothetical protein